MLSFTVTFCRCCFDDLVQDYSISISNALQILYSNTKPSIFCGYELEFGYFNIEVFIVPVAAAAFAFVHAIDNKHDTHRNTKSTKFCHTCAIFV